MIPEAEARVSGITPEIGVIPEAEARVSGITPEIGVIPEAAVPTVLNRWKSFGEALSETGVNAAW
ncbi:hypothetical protein [Boudabousia marimammalium]|uniref:Uncharacterized protein n=1 Tax=Boudabousia marimammalium TaxID=156892 RepID=A0A1Q5PKG1_9ACTO|nr:hypothetical protein [Boudabousia marimammalium]OKL46692.1 hypothetical protein BM477_06985 [Boudabousia marimammalium]